MPGVLDAFSAADLGPEPGRHPGAVPRGHVEGHPQYPLARDTVRYVGEGVAVVIAETRAIAEDACELVDVDYEVLPAVVDAVAAIAPGATALHPDAPDNVGASLVYAVGDADAAFAAADRVVGERLDMQRYTGIPLETRGVAAQRDPVTGEMTIWASNQWPHILRGIVAGMLGLAERSVRVITPRCRRRLRLQGRGVPRGRAGALRHRPPRQAGQMDRGPQRALPHARALPRADPLRRAGLRRRRDDHRPARQADHRYRRLPAHARSDQLVARGHQPRRALQHPEHPRRRRLRGHEQEPRLPVPRSGSARGVLRPRAADRHRRAGAGRRPRRAAPSQPRPAGADALRHRTGIGGGRGHPRQRRLPGRVGPSPRDGGLRRVRREAGGRPGRGPPDRAGHLRLPPDLGHGPVRGRERARRPFRSGDRQRGLRPPRPGHGHDAGPDRRRRAADRPRDRQVRLRRHRRASPSASAPSPAATP